MPEGNAHADVPSFMARNRIDTMRTAAVPADREKCGLVANRLPANDITVVASKLALIPVSLLA